MSTPTPPTGFPTDEEVRRAYDETDLHRAIHAYKHFFPAVSAVAIDHSNLDVGMVPNRVFATMDTGPRQVGFTLNSDTPYGPALLDLRDGPLVVELPPGPLMGVLLDLNQRWLADIGIPGPDAGRGGRYLLVPPGADPDPPADAGYLVRSTTHRVIFGVRAVPVDGDVAGAFALIRQVRIRPLDPPSGWQEPEWIDLSDVDLDQTPAAWERDLRYWRALHELVDTEPPIPEWRTAYGDLAALGIAAGTPFAPDARMEAILVRAAETANTQMRVQSFADRRPDRLPWPDRHWEWAALRQDEDLSAAPGVIDLEAREKWFFQAIAVSPAMMRRAVGGGSLYWLGLRDADGAYLDGGRTYRIDVPRPVPARLFWSVTVYDAQTRSQIRTEQDRAALRSLFELAAVDGDGPVDLWFGPEEPEGAAGRWIRTLPGRGWFSYFRLYGPEEPAFDGSWRPSDPVPVGAG